MIKPIVEILKHYNGQFHIYGDATPETINASELAGYDNIHVKGYLPHAQLIDTLRNTSHVLYSPLAFLPEDDNMRLCFPSKLVDYTAVGLPIILHGPPYASQMRWATQYPDSFVTIDSMDTQAIERAILRLTDPATRHSLASNAIALGQKVFSWETAWKTFTHCLLNP
ncbi:MAG: hypothetical protein NZM04_07530 [Methylacidiphilales bacterium]|nr:hypothetical protein [Candidatus Methylacidiphilales bacterium]MDW8349547.1 hypothetical protein [Verrucomicrobiae bacterium]